MPGQCTTVSFLDFLSPKGSHVMENYSLTKLAILSICLYTFKKSVGDWVEGVEKSLEGA